MNKLILIISIFLATFVSKGFAQTKAEKLFFDGDYKSALKVIQKSIDNDKARIAEYILAAKCSDQLFDYKAAILYYKQAIDLDASNLKVFEGLANAQYNLGFKKEALANLESILKADSTNIRIQGKKAGLLMELLQYEKAEELLTGLYLQDSSNVYFLRKLMQSRYKLQKYSYILDLFFSNRYFPEKNNELMFIVANCFIKINEIPQALLVLSEILERDPDYVLALAKIANVQFASYRNYEDAVVYYRRLVKLENYRNPLHLKNLSICEYFTGNQEYASVTLDSLCRMIDNDPIVPFYAGLAYKKLGNVDKSLEFLEKAADMVIPSYAADIFHHLGRSYASKRMFDEALATYKKVREYDPHNYQVLYDIAVTYEEYNLNRTMAYAYYIQFTEECTNERSVDLRYAQNRIKRIKEEQFFEGD